MNTNQKISPCLWFDGQAEEAANFYVSIFPDSHIGDIGRFPEGGPGEPGSVVTVVFYLNGEEYLALNGGPDFKFTEAVSLMVKCRSQDEIDHYWEKLLAGGGQESQCGWLKDKFGLSWQVAPVQLMDIWAQPDTEKATRAMQAMMRMKKINLKEIEEA